MQPRILARSIVGAAALGLITLSVGPSRGATPPKAPATVTHIAGLKQGRLQGILVALHPRQRTGDLALADGTLAPLRFRSLAQLRGLHVGDLLMIVTHTRGAARLLVSSWHKLADGSHWTGSHWTGSHWTGSHWNGSHWNGSHWNGSHWTFHLRGVVERHVRGDVVEMSGFNGAAVLVHVSQAPVSVASQATPSSAGVAYAEAPPSVAAGEAVETQMRLTVWGSLVATSVTVTALHVPAVAIEGTIIAVNHRTGAMTLKDENGLTTTVTLPASDTAYHAGQSCDVSGSMSASTIGAATMHAQSAEIESTPQGQGSNTTAPTATSTPVAQGTPQATATITPTATATVVMTTTPPQTATTATATATATESDQQGDGSLYPGKVIATRTAKPQAWPTRTPQTWTTTEPDGTTIVWATRTPLPSRQPTRTPLPTAQPTRTSLAPATPTNTPAPLPTATRTPRAWATAWAVYKAKG